MNVAGIVPAEQVCKLLAHAQCDLSNEKRCQSDIASVLTVAGITFAREHRLADGDVIDFLVGDIGIEVKLRRTSKRDIYRQLGRYALHPTIGALILVTNTSMGLPRAIHGKPTYYVSLGRAWV